MSYIYEPDELPIQIKKFLDDRIAESRGSGPFLWEPERYIVGSEIIPIRFSGETNNFRTEGFEVLEEFLHEDGRQFPRFGGGRGFGELLDGSVEFGSPRFVFRPVSDRNLKNRLREVYEITKPSSVVIGEEVFELLNDVFTIEQSRFFQVPAFVEGHDECVGNLYLFDPELRLDIVDLENSQVSWRLRSDGRWGAVPKVNPWSASIKFGKEISVARSRKMSGGYLIDKSLKYTFARMGIPGFLEQDAHKAYFDYKDFEPRDLRGTGS